ncbi:hypothetical protein CsSME_00005738 [Camellia sinensis var. sinensis]
MVNSSRRRRAVGSSRSKYPAVKATHFFKIVKSSADRLQKLRIPRKFMTKHGKNLANLVFLNVPSGAVWKVELMNSNEEVWLSSGWKEFTEYYSIRFGHFLVFRYDGNSNFHVLIFDMSASEIEYPFNPTQNLLLPEAEEDIEIDNSVEILEDFPTHQTKVEEVSGRDEIEKDSSVEILDDFPKCQTRRAADMEKDGYVEVNRTNRRRKMENFDGLKVPNLKMDVKPSCLTHEMKKERSVGTSIDGKARALQRAKRRGRALEAAEKFMSTSNYPSFIRVIHPAYLCKGYLSIAMSFVNTHMKKSKTTVKLQVSDKLWPVNLISYQSSSSAMLCGGFTAFAKEQSLQVGDVCIFELIDRDNDVLKVSIFRNIN